MDVNQPIDRLNIEVTTNAAEASKGLKSIASALGKIASTVPKLKKINVSPAVGKIKELSKSLQNINIEIDKIENLKSVGNILSKVANAIPKIAEMDMSASTGHINQLTVSLKHLAEQCERIASSDIVGILRSLSKINFSKLEKAMRGNLQYPAMYTSSYSGYNQGRFRDPGDGIPPNWTNFKKDWEWFYNTFSDWNRRMIGDGRGEPLTADWYNESDIPIGKYENTIGKKIIDAFDKTASDIGDTFSQMIHSIGRITFYRAVRFALKLITQFVKEGLQMIYTYSYENNGSFAKTMNDISSSVNYIKASLGSTTSVLMQAFEPMISALASGIVNLSNSIAGITSFFSGQDTYIKAVKVQTEAMNLLNRQMQQMTLGIDELNILGRNQGKTYDYEEAKTPSFWEVGITIAKGIRDTVFQSGATRIANLVMSAIGSDFRFSTNPWLTGLTFASDVGEEIAREIQDAFTEETFIQYGENIKPLVAQMELYTTALATLNATEEEAIARMGDMVGTPKQIADAQAMAREAYEEQRQALIDAIRELSIYIDGNKVGEVVTHSQNNTARRTSFGTTVTAR